MTRIAVIWSRFGPYHLARLQGAAEAGRASGVDLFGVEVASSDRQYAWDKVDGAEGFHRSTVFTEANYDNLSARQIYEGIFQTLDRIDPTVVATNGWSVAEAQAGLIWCRRRKRRCVVMSETKADDSRRRAWKEFVKRLIVHRFDAALVGGRQQAEYLVRLDYPRDRVHFGYDVVDNDFFTSSVARTRADRDNLQASYGLPDEYFFACSRFLPRKNIDGLLRAYAVYRARGPKPLWGLVIAGSGEQEGRLRALERELGLEGVVWPGFVQYSELPVYFGLASAFVHPAKSEPWGLVVNEAAASGLPLLVSRKVGASYEFVQEGKNGFLFEPAEPHDIAQTLLGASRRTIKQRQSMGSRAQQTACQWGPDRFGAGLLAAAGL
jgi:glycosyltransferase involved in cell wall biosynthesis